MQPLVSIIIPVYNGANYMRAAIDSALAQTYENCEILVINDGSNDDGETERIALTYGDKIRYFSKHNGGVATALNMGIENMRGEYFSWLSHDDMYHKNKINSQIEALSVLEDKATLVTCGFTIIDAKGQKIKDDGAADYTNKQLGTPLFVFLQGIIKGGLLFGCSLFIHKSHFERVGTFNAELMTNDVDLWFRIMRNQPLYYLREPLAIKRTHNAQDTITKSDILAPAFNEFVIDVLEKLTDDEIVQVFGSRFAMYEAIINTYYGTEVALYAIAKASEERLYLVRAAKAIDERRLLLSDTMLTRKQHESVVKAVQEQYEAIIRETKQAYENSTSWKLTKPIRAVSRLLRWAKGE